MLSLPHPAWAQALYLVSRLLLPCCLQGHVCLAAVNPRPGGRHTGPRLTCRPAPQGGRRKNFPPTCHHYHRLVGEEDSEHASPLHFAWCKEGRWDSSPCLWGCFWAGRLQPASSKLPLGTFGRACHIWKSMACLALLGRGENFAHTVSSILCCILLPGAAENLTQVLAACLPASPVLEGTFNM